MKLKRSLAVSTVIANMLMIVITLALAAILVAWAGSSYGAFTGGSQIFFLQRGQALQERFVTENVYFNRGQNFIRIFVRNVGVEEINVVAIYVNGTTALNSPGGTCTVPGSPANISVGRVCEFRLAWTIWTVGNPPVGGLVFNFLVATARGNQVTYTARGPS